MEKSKESTEIKETIIGDFKPKRKFLNFVSSVNGLMVRFIRDIAFIKGEKLSGILDGLIFKITICDEGTIKFEEVDTFVTDKAQLQRLIDDIDMMNVTGYAQKFVLPIEFSDINGDTCYLEVEHKKPIDVLKSLFDDEEKQGKKLEEKTLSNKGMSLLDDLFNNSSDSERLDLSDNTEIPDNAEIKISEELNEKVEVAKVEIANSYIMDSFKEMNKEKINEIKKRIRDNELDSVRLKSQITQYETKLKEINKNLEVLETRLDSFNSNDELNGYVFNVSEEKKEEVGLTEENREMADKIADIIGLRKEALFNMLTQGYYKICVAKKSDIKNEKVNIIPRDVLEKISSITISDPNKNAKITMINNGEFEYRGDFTWHQIIGKMVRKGFEQDPEFDKYCQSNSYESHEENKESKMKDEKIKNCNDKCSCKKNCGCKTK